MAFFLYLPHLLCGVGEIWYQHIFMLNICEFCENWHRESRAFLADLSEVTFMCVHSSRMIFLKQRIFSESLYYDGACTVCTMCSLVEPWVWSDVNPCDCVMPWVGIKCYAAASSMEQWLLQLTIFLLMQRICTLMIKNCHELATKRDIGQVRLFPAHVMQAYGRNVVYQLFLNIGTGYRWVVMLMPWLLASQFPALPWCCADHSQPYRQVRLTAVILFGMRLSCSHLMYFVLP